jgi:hypothetical protein
MCWCLSIIEVAVHFIRELNEYFTLRKDPWRTSPSISIPFDLGSICVDKLNHMTFMKVFTELLWDGTWQSEIRSRVYQDRYNCRSGESLSEYYTRYADMASMLSPAMSDQDLFGAMITHYEPSIQTCLINANLKLTQETLAFLTKLQSLENLREQYKSAWWVFELQN